MTVRAAICTKKGWNGIVQSSEKSHPQPVKSDVEKRETLILGLGNTILRDDGAGIYVAREIGKRIRNTDVVVKEASLGGLELLELMKGFDRVVLIDAILTGGHEVGSLVELTIDDLKGGSALTRHQVSFSEALELGRKVGMDLPEEIKIYGIEVQDTRTFSESCTDEVGKRISEIAEEIIHSVFVHDGQG